MREFDLFVPGRLALIGEHSDWAGQYRIINPRIEKGYGIVAVIGKGIKAKVISNSMFVVKAFGDVFFCNMASEDLLAIAQSDNFFSYACGVAKYMLDKYNVPGIEIEVTEMDLPIKKGLSSSAAICVLVARAFNLMYDLKLSSEEEIVIAYYGEHIAESFCGRLDQVCAYGRGLLSLVFDGDDVEIRSIDAKGKFYFVVADLMAVKDTKKIFTSLNRAYPFPNSEIEHELHNVLGLKTKEYALDMISCLENGDPIKLGKLLTEYQQIFDDITIQFCPSELLAPKLHRVLSDNFVRDLSYGGKGVGSQGDGSVQVLARDLESQLKLIDYFNNTLEMDAYSVIVSEDSEKNEESLSKTIKF